MPEANLNQYLHRYASFAPTGNGVVYVDQNNDIYFRRSVYGMVSESSIATLK